MSAVPRCIVLLAALLSGCSWTRGWMSDPVAEARDLADQAEVAREEGDERRAAALLEQAVRANPEGAEHHQALASLLLKQGKTDAAVEHLRLSISANADDPRAHYQLADVLFHQGRYDEAQAALSRVLQLNAAYPEALMLMGTLSERMGRDEAALGAYYQLLAGNPDNIEAKLRIAGIHLRSDKPENAAHVLRSICQCNEASQQQKCDAQWQLGRAYARQERWPEACETMSSAVGRRQLTTADEWCELANVRFRAGDAAGAREAADQALALEPGHRSAIVLAQHLAPLGSNPGNAARFDKPSTRPRSARGEFERVLTRDPL
jgi:tetratricopeptide (TPR) repeat protein